MFFALDATTLPKTVHQLAHPQIIIAAGNENEGIAAAKATGMPFAVPKREGEDWWDVFNREGKEGVRRSLQQAHLPKSVDPSMLDVMKTSARPCLRLF